MSRLAPDHVMKKPKSFRGSAMRCVSDGGGGGGPTILMMIPAMRMRIVITVSSHSPDPRPADCGRESIGVRYRRPKKKKTMCTQSIIDRRTGARKSGQKVNSPKHEIAAPILGPGSPGLGPESWREN